LHALRKTIQEKRIVAEVMTVSEVAEYLRVNPQTVYRKAKAGELPAVRIGRAIRFRRSELEAWCKGFTPSKGQGGVLAQRRN